MITLQHSINLLLTEAEIKLVMQKALAQFDIAKRDNLRHRHINIQYDCILRGYIGEYAFTKWLAAHHITCSAHNLINDGDNMDIDFYYKNKNIELKTSLVPDADGTLAATIANRDIKIIQRDNDITKLKGDVHVQILYDQRRKLKDEYLQKMNIDFNSVSLDELYNTLLAKAYKNTCYIVGWIDKQSLTKHVESLPLASRSWSFVNSKRLFYTCKISQSNMPSALIEYLHNL